MEVAGKRVTIMGLGRHGGGVAAARYLAEQGAVATVTDLADEEALAESLEEMGPAPLRRLHLGGHRAEDFREADLVVVNPAVRPGNPFVALAAEAGARITSEIELFLAACPAHVVGVTGSNGKSSTAAMTAAILSADGRRVWLGGNIGRSLLSDLGRIVPDDWVVLELSSFQLARLPPGERLAEVAIITNCTANHLDWHGSFAAYTAAKRRLLAGQTAGDLAVLNTADAVVRSFRYAVRGRHVEPLPDDQVGPLAVPGAHQRANAACAAAAAAGIGCSTRAIERGLASFAGLPHRLEFVGRVAGRQFYNDSLATTPESTLAALAAFPGRCWLLVGGRDKGIDFGPLAASIARRARGVALYGAVRDKLAALVGLHWPRCPSGSFETMSDALAWCWARSSAGDVIALSPASASYDQFRDYRDRGAKFIELVRALAERASCNERRVSIE